MSHEPIDRDRHEIPARLSDAVGRVLANVVRAPLPEDSTGAGQHLPSTPRPDDTTWAPVVDVLNAHYYEPDIEAVRAFYAAVAAHDLSGQPVWPMAVAPPSSMKTEVIRALDGLPRVHSIDAVTSKTFISGQIRDQGNLRVPTGPSSLLHRIGASGILLCPDFSTVLAIKSDDRNAILADLRRIYDGELRKEFGTSEPVPIWKGRITLVAAVTEEIDRHYSVIQSLGDRFLMIRWSRAGQEAAIRAMTQDIERARADLKAAVHALFNSLPRIEPTVAASSVLRLAALAELAARARSYVPRGGPDKSVIGDPQAESAPRLAQQLCQLMKGSARLSHRDAANSEDFEAARRAAFDCIPPRRRLMLEWAINERGNITANSSTQQYDRGDLQVLGLVEDNHLSPLAKRLLRQIDQDDQFTRHPPDTNDRIGAPAGFGGTSREASGGGVL